MLISKLEVGHKPKVEESVRAELDYMADMTAERPKPCSMSSQKKLLDWTLSNNDYGR